ncbi:MAG: hypothetical protein H7A45_02155 [Verrucomicrobiales bacterium]|nr:hypothetical protein [Verrucomicrobiales bacterium]MCP5526533.1 hypothetical protein [Verrucomicrobiales bacterium]
MNATIPAEETPDVEPICPHCETPVRRVCYRRLSSFLGVRYVYFCSACRKVLGISHRKGFWMG